MDFKAEPKTIEEVFSYKKKMVIPRFQREFVWEKEKLEILWNDILDNLELKNGNLIPTEYFLGSLVLIDGDDPQIIERQVIDGQQRLTVLTIIFSVLYEAFKKANNTDLADIIYGYVITKDNNGLPITLLETESPKPFFQFRIQAKDKETDRQPSTKEEERLLDAYLFFEEKVSPEILKADMKSRFDIESDNISILKVIRDQILRCKLVYVTVKSINDAYMIFEVLNAKGEPLESVDLVKNALFSILSDTEPADDAKIKWENIKKNIEKFEELNKFYRYFWLSRYHFVREKKLYLDFTKLIKNNKTSYKKFLKELELSSVTYKKILIPSMNDWNTTEKNSIFYNLQSFSIFDVSQVRTIVLTLLDSYNKKKIRIKLLKECLDFLEAFHFVFSAICSARPSGLESRYSKYALKIFNEQDKSKIGKIIEEFKTDMTSRIPSYELFLSKFKELYFTNEEEKDKKKIQYIFSKIERSKLSTNELEIAYISLEHILSQNSKNKIIGYIGNLLPLSAELNSECKSKDFTSKKIIYRKSNFKTVQHFCDINEQKSSWEESDINKRTEELAHYMYFEICKFGKN